MAKSGNKMWFKRWWNKINPTWQAVISIGMIFSAGFTVGVLFNNRSHSMEIIENNQKHNLNLQLQHDEFENKLYDLMNQLEECRHQYRLLEIEKIKGESNEEK